MDDQIRTIRGGQIISDLPTPVDVKPPTASSGYASPPLPSDNGEYSIPSYDALKGLYDAHWLKAKEKFYNELKENFRALTEQFRVGKQEIYQLTVTTAIDKYIRAFRELFADAGYQATVSDIERSSCGNKKSQKLYITLPDCVR